MATIRIEVQGRSVKWDVVDEAAITVLQALVNGLGPAHEDDGDE